jgi:hypothetical protein
MPTATARGSVTANREATWGTVIVVLAVPDTGASLSDLTVIDCRPAVASVTWNDARPFRNVTGTSGNSAAGSLLTTVADPLNDDRGLPAASTATAVTLIGTPARAWDGIVIRSDSRTTGSVTAGSRTTGSVTGLDTLPEAAAGGGATSMGESVFAVARGGITAMPMPLSIPRASSCSATHTGTRTARDFFRRDETVPKPRDKKVLIVVNPSECPSRNRGQFPIHPADFIDETD